MTTYKKYLFILNDKYSLSKLKSYSVEKPTNLLNEISIDSYTNAKLILGCSVDNVTLNDKLNKKIAKLGFNTITDISNPKTLFAPYCLTYDPDIYQTGPIGWPINNKNFQDLGYQTVKDKKPSCIVFAQNGLIRQSPYTSHCSAYVGWITQKIYGISLVPTQIGDWCHAAAEQRDIMYNLKDWWDKVDSVSAQTHANNGKLVIAAKKIDDPEREGYKQNGHIAIVLPCVWKLAMQMQKNDYYPKTPVISDENTFSKFIKINGPEIIQAGGLNFSHTVASNGFANYYMAGQTPGVTPIDNVVEFFVYKLYTQTKL